MGVLLDDRDDQPAESRPEIEKQTPPDERGRRRADQEWGKGNTEGAGDERRAAPHPGNQATAENRQTPESSQPTLNPSLPRFGEVKIPPILPQQGLTASAPDVIQNARTHDRGQDAAEENFPPDHFATADAMASVSHHHISGNWNGNARFLDRQQAKQRQLVVMVK